MNGVNQRQAALRALPSVDELLALSVCQEAVTWLARPLLVDIVRESIEEARRGILSETSAPAASDGDRNGLIAPASSPAIDWEKRLAAAFARAKRRFLTPVINATGVVLHTNLGRAPLSEAAIDAVSTVSRGYSNLEYDLQRGVRGSRHVHGEALLTMLTGAEAAMIVNNNAAAVLLVLSALASGKEVLLSRGELIEIGGAFRIPEVMAQSGCRLVEIGTTNRTHLRDYESHINEETAAILKVHTSNYKIEGFTKSVGTRELAALASRTGVLLIEDLGSGVLLPTERYGLAHEPTLQEAIEGGAHIVTCSGDKLFGGPQAGIIVGRKELVDRCRNHPLARAVRVDKMSLAALQATLMHYARGEVDHVPIWRMMGASLESLQARAQAMCAGISARLAAHTAPTGSAPSAPSAPAERWEIEAALVESAVGGGSLPGETLPSWAIRIRGGRAPQRLADTLRHGLPPIVGRIEQDALLLDLRTVDPADDERVAAAVADALRTLRVPLE